MSVIIGVYCAQKQTRVFLFFFCIFCTVFKRLCEDKISPKQGSSVYYAFKNISNTAKKTTNKQITPKERQKRGRRITREKEGNIWGKKGTCSATLWQRRAEADGGDPLRAFARASFLVKRPFSLGGGQGGIFHGEDCKCSVVASLRLSGSREKSSPRSRKQTHAEIRKQRMNKEGENARKKRDSLHNTKKKTRCLPPVYPSCLGSELSYLFRLFFLFFSHFVFHVKQILFFNITSL